MREVNFSIPNVNKASVGITTALYDRRALDCTSTLPLINSLNHLAYLTTSSARIRDILTVDGGIERLVCILKQGRSKDMMDMWKWNLAFQCVVNIGVRGTEAVRTRVVEADMVPVIATILDNYIKVIEKCREKAEEAKQRHAREHHGRHRLNDLRVAKSSFTHRTLAVDLDHRSSRRQAPPPSIDVSATFAGPSTVALGDHTGAASSIASSSAAAAAAAVAAAAGTASAGGSAALSAASSTDGSTSNTDNDATPTMSQFHITSPAGPQHSARSSMSSPPPVPVQSSLPSSLAPLSASTSLPTPVRRFHHHHHNHHHHHLHASAAGPSSSSSSTATLATPSANNNPIAASSAAMATAAAATSATPSRHPLVPPSGAAIQPLSSAVPSAASVNASEVNEANLLRAMRDLDQYASPYGLARPLLGNSQPASPTTPLPPPQLRSPTVRPTSLLAPTGRSRRRPSIRHQNSTSGPAADVDDLNAESVQSDETPDAEMSGTAEMQGTVDIQDINMEEADSMLGGESLELTTPTVSETQDTGAFNITHRGPLDGSITPAATTAPVPAMGLSPNRPPMVTAQQPVMPTASVPRYLLDRHLTPHPQVIASMPREEDVLMSLQLLAYVSKYCNLRSYFQKSHLVPRLKIGRELQLLDGDDLSGSDSMGSGATVVKMEDGDLENDSTGISGSIGALSNNSTATTGSDDGAEDEEEEYLLPNDLNIFPLVEKFTVRYHSTDMQYWAGVVMRNLCRKDESRGGIRQCAYYQCGKWEKFTRQFAKCRRCRRTKYCSKECQKSAWAFHRHWCVAASQ
ncbi:mynd domain containing protein [Sporothrix brasiliensis 5110]|uniref:MYND-type zinc finger protein samB n=1 Tax=Sporothrix brasiliensis 5110 TaxID=1398154 RepID=A0A0C2J181_9PEZI|nr:mynd domain containing protein [Sporothrix brasiliensis 5110]KIH90877.1 mynd domain containing protein [Sporothrix brasiliensis 5110]